VVERPRAVSEYVVERLTLGGADKICFVISPNKTDIIRYYGARFEHSSVAYVVQPEPAGLCDAFFRPAPFVGPEEPVALGLPDTIWFPEDALRALPEDRLSFLLFPVQNPQAFDVVLTDEHGRVQEIQVKPEAPRSEWVWGAFRAPGAVYHQLHDLWRRRDRQDVYLGTLVNAWMEGGGEAVGVKAGESYVDVGTFNGYREALRLLTGRPESLG
jgi:dTDP-glucose pyrophosphorylase